MENRKQKTGDVKLAELTSFLFSVFGFLFSIPLVGPKGGGTS